MPITTCAAFNVAHPAFTHDALPHLPAGMMPYSSFHALLKDLDAIDDRVTHGLVHIQLQTIARANAMAMQAEVVATGEGSTGGGRPRSSSPLKRALSPASLSRSLVASGGNASSMSSSIVNGVPTEVPPSSLLLPAQPPATAAGLTCDDWFEALVRVGELIRNTRAPQQQSSSSSSSSQAGSSGATGADDGWLSQLPAARSVCSDFLLRRVLPLLALTTADDAAGAIVESPEVVAVMVQHRGFLVRLFNNYATSSAAAGDTPPASTAACDAGVAAVSTLRLHLHSYLALARDFEVCPSLLPRSDTQAAFYAAARRGGTDGSGEGLLGCDRVGVTGAGGSAGLKASGIKHAGHSSNSTHASNPLQRDPASAYLTFTSFCECLARLALVGFSRPYLSSQHPSVAAKAVGLIAWMQAARPAKALSAAAADTVRGRKASRAKPPAASASSSSAPRGRSTSASHLSAFTAVLDLSAVPLDLQASIGYAVMEQSSLGGSSSVSSSGGGLVPVAAHDQPRSLAALAGTSSSSSSAAAGLASSSSGGGWRGRYSAAGSSSSDAHHLDLPYDQMVRQAMADVGLIAGSDVQLSQPPPASAATAAEVHHQPPQQQTAAADEDVRRHHQHHHEQQQVHPEPIDAMQLLLGGVSLTGNDGGDTGTGADGGGSGAALALTLLADQMDSAGHADIARSLRQRAGLDTAAPAITAAATAAPSSQAIEVPADAASSSSNGTDGRPPAVGAARQASHGPVIKTTAKATAMALMGQFKASQPPPFRGYSLPAPVDASWIGGNSSSNNTSAVNVSSDSAHAAAAVASNARDDTDGTSTIDAASDRYSYRDPAEASLVGLLDLPQRQIAATSDEPGALYRPGEASFYRRIAAGRMGALATTVAITMRPGANMVEQHQLRQLQQSAAAGVSQRHPRGTAVAAAVAPADSGSVTPSSIAGSTTVDDDAAMVARRPSPSSGTLDVDGSPAKPARTLEELAAAEASIDGDTDEYSHHESVSVAGGDGDAMTMDDLRGSQHQRRGRSSAATARQRPSATARRDLQSRMSPSGAHRHYDVDAADAMVPPVPLQGELVRAFRNSFRAPDLTTTQAGFGSSSGMRVYTNSLKGNQSVLHKWDYTSAVATGVALPGSAPPPLPPALLSASAVNSQQQQQLASTAHVVRSSSAGPVGSFQASSAGTPRFMQATASRAAAMAEEAALVAATDAPGDHQQAAAASRLASSAIGADGLAWSRLSRSAVAANDTSAPSHLLSAPSSTQRLYIPSRATGRPFIGPGSSNFKPARYGLTKEAMRQVWDAVAPPSAGTDGSALSPSRQQLHQREDSVLLAGAGSPSAQPSSPPRRAVSPSQLARLSPEAMVRLFFPGYEGPSAAAVGATAATSGSAKGQKSPPPAVASPPSTKPGPSSPAMQRLAATRRRSPSKTKPAESSRVAEVVSAALAEAQAILGLSGIEAEAGSSMAAITRQSQQQLTTAAQPRAGTVQLSSPPQRTAAVASPPRGQQSSLQERANNSLSAMLHAVDNIDTAIARAAASAGGPGDAGGVGLPGAGSDLRVGRHLLQQPIPPPSSRPAQYLKADTVYGGEEDGEGGYEME